MDDNLKKYQAMSEKKDKEIKKLTSLLIENQQQLKKALEENLLIRAIERYDGVAYEYLGFGSLEIAAQEYIVQNTIIFSNIFGPIAAGDLIPN